MHARSAMRCHAAAANGTHIHIVASWYGERDAMVIHKTFKRLLGWRCAKVHAIPGRRWISHGGYPKRVADFEHLQHLVKEYLPKQGGVFWNEGDPVPSWTPAPTLSPPLAPPGKARAESRDGF